MKLKEVFLGSLMSVLALSMGCLVTIENFKLKMGWKWKMVILDMHARYCDVNRLKMTLRTC